MTTWKMYSESKPLFSDLYLVKFKDGCFLGEYGVCYYSDEHKEFGEFISFYDSERDEDDEAFVSRESIVAWAPFQRIDEEHKEKTAEQMFNDLGYTKRVFDDFIVYKIFLVFFKIITFFIILYFYKKINLKLKL